jgi:hypothetical protein
MAGGATLQRRLSGGGFYDNSDLVTYYPVGGGEHDFGAGGATYRVKPPKGKTMGHLVDVFIECTETFTADTTAGEVRVGNSNDDDKYGTLTCDTTVTTGEVWNSADQNIHGATGADGDGMIDMSRDGAAGAAIDDVEIEFVAPTGGTPAGKGHVGVSIRWF